MPKYELLRKYIQERWPTTPAIGGIMKGRTMQIQRNSSPYVVNVFLHLEGVKLTSLSNGYVSESEALALLRALPSD